MLFAARKKTVSITLGYKGHLPYNLGLGNLRIPYIRSPHTLSGKKLHLHEHVMGVSGGGKSYYLAKKYTDLVTQGIGAALIDPHGDLAEDCLTMLIDRGYFKRKDAYEKLWYIDFTLKDRFVPFNILKTPYPHYTTGRHVSEAFKRAYSANLSGEGAAPVFSDMSQFTSITLAANGLPITEATRLLADKNYREMLLQNVDHTQTQEYFHLRYDRWDERDRTSKVESFLNKLSDLTVTDPMYYALCQSDNILDFQKHINEGRSLIFNIHVDDPETRRLLGCLQVVGFENAALTRKKEKRTFYHLIIDEFASFSSNDGASVKEMLSQARKYNFWLTLAHQTVDQLSESMKSAVQNMLLETFFGLNFDDAQLIAPRIGRYDPYHTKHEPKPLKGHELTVEQNPVYFQMQEQWHEMVRKLENLHPQEAFVRVKRPIPVWLQRVIFPYKTFKMRSCTLPKQKCRNQDIQQVKDNYAALLLKTKAEVELDVNNHATRTAYQPDPVLSRRSPLTSKK